MCFVKPNVAIRTCNRFLWLSHRASHLHFHFFKKNIRDDVLQALSFLPMATRVARLAGPELRVFRWSRVTYKVAIIASLAACRLSSFRLTLRAGSSAAVIRPVVYPQRTARGIRSAVICHTHSIHRRQPVISRLSFPRIGPTARRDVRFRVPNPSVNSAQCWFAHQHPQ
jgi:hypothetical protein